MTPPTPLELATFMRGTQALKLRADQWRWFWTKWGGGRLDDPESFNAAGGTTGALGFYPVVWEDDTIRYLPCQERFIAILRSALNGSPNLVAHMRGRPMTEVLADDLPAGALFVLPIVSGAPDVVLGQSFTEMVGWGEERLIEAIVHDDTVEILMTWDD